LLLSVSHAKHATHEKMGAMRIAFRRIDDRRHVLELTRPVHRRRDALQQLAASSEDRHGATPPRRQKSWRLGA
jgi:hypothetical protein